jgi:hypothetical protein
MGREPRTLSTPISVKVKHPEIEQTVSRIDFKRWLESTPIARRDDFEKSLTRAPRQGLRAPFRVRRKATEQV